MATLNKLRNHAGAAPTKAKSPTSAREGKVQTKAPPPGIVRSEVLSSATPRSGVPGSARDPLAFAQSLSAAQTPIAMQGLSQAVSTPHRPPGSARSPRPAPQGSSQPSQQAAKSSLDAHTASTKIQKMFRRKSRAGNSTESALAAARAAAAGSCTKDAPLARQAMTNHHSQQHNLRTPDTPDINELSPYSDGNQDMFQAGTGYISSPSMSHSDMNEFAFNRTRTTSSPMQSHPEDESASVRSNLFASPSTATKGRPIHPNRQQATGHAAEGVFTACDNIPSDRSIVAMKVVEERVNSGRCTVEGIGLLDNGLTESNIYDFDKVHKRLLCCIRINELVCRILGVTSCSSCVLYMDPSRCVGLCNASTSPVGTKVCQTK